MLLLQDVDPARPGRHWRWGTIGGALDPGETPTRRRSARCARRPASSSTRRPDPARSTAASREFSWAGVDYRSENTFFAMPMAADVEVSFDHLGAGGGRQVGAGLGLVDAGRTRPTEAPWPRTCRDIMALAVEAVLGR